MLSSNTQHLGVNKRVESQSRTKLDILEKKKKIVYQAVLIGLIGFLTFVFNASFLLSVDVLYRYAYEFCGNPPIKSEFNMQFSNT